MNQSGEKRVPLEVGSMQVIGGTVADLAKAEGRLNLIEALQGQSNLSGIVLGMAGQAGAAAMAASVSLYDGEGVEHFASSLGDKVITGTFEKITFENGDEVKVVASPLANGVMFAHAVVRVSDGMLWMPYNVNEGRGGLVKTTAKIAKIIMLGGFVLLVPMMFFIGGLDAIELHAIVLLAYFSMIACIGVVVYRDGLPEALYAEKILKKLGFKNPRIVSLKAFSLSSQSGHQMQHGHSIFMLRKALSAYGCLAKNSSAKQI